MNYDVPDDDAAVAYYDGDYPSLELGPATPEDVESLRRNGLLGDVPFYCDMAAETAGGEGGTVLELGCGTGRLGIPLARAGHRVVGVDISHAMLERYRRRLKAEPDELRGRVTVYQADATRLALPDAGFSLVAIPFNVLNLMADRVRQRSLLAVAARHLAPGGLVALDVMNPLMLPLSGDDAPQPSYPRTNPDTGGRYVKHVTVSRIDEEQCQQIHGWYEEPIPGGGALTSDFSYWWRLIFRGELTALLELAGLTEVAAYGDFERTPWSVDAGRIVIVAKII